MLRLKERKGFSPDEIYYQNLIAKAILFRQTEKLVQKQQYGGYRANIVTYTLAFLSFKTAQRIDLERIWKEQALTPALEREIIEVSKFVQSLIVNPPGGSNVGEWCKKEKCWQSIRDHEYTLSDELQLELLSVARPTIGSQPATGSIDSLTDEELVFPERIQSIFIFTLIKLLHNIAEGKIERAYDPEAFKPGEKLKLGNAVVEFVGIEDEKNERRMKIKVADLTISAPIEYFPLFQLTNTQRRLSPYEKYVVEKKKIEGLVSHLTADEKFLKMLADYRTHMDSSIVSMTSVINAKELLSTCKLCGRDIKSILLVGQADYEGNVKNVGAGQLGGVPAVVLASDLYAIAALADQGHPIQSIIIDGSNANILLSQMDALDNLMRLGVPITCVTDIVNSFDLQPFLDRQFNVWRWDETSITDHLYNVNPLSSDRKIKHCAKREVKYLVSDGNEISIAIRKLYFHRGETQTLSVQMLKLFDKLFSLAFVALHETVPFNDDQLIRPKLILDECSSILAGEKNYLASKTYINRHYIYSFPKCSYGISEITP